MAKSRQGDAEVEVEGYYNDLVLARAAAEGLDEPLDALADAVVAAYLQPPSVLRGLSFVEYQLELGEGFWREFEKGTEFDYAVSENTRGFMKLCDDAYQRAADKDEWVDGLGRSKELWAA